MPSPLAGEAFFISNAGKIAQEIGAETFLSVLLICVHAEKDLVAKTKWQLKTRKKTDTRNSHQDVRSNDFFFEIALMQNEFVWRGNQQLNP